MLKVFHTKIETETIAKNGSTKFGATAKCKYWFGKNPKLKIDVSKHGSTEEQVKTLLINFLNGNGMHEAIVDRGN